MPLHTLPCDPSWMACWCKCSTQSFLQLPWYSCPNHRVMNILGTLQTSQSYHVLVWQTFRRRYNELGNIKDIWHRYSLLQVIPIAWKNLNIKRSSHSRPLSLILHQACQNNLIKKNLSLFWSNSPMAPMIETRFLRLVHLCEAFENSSIRFKNSLIIHEPNNLSKHR